MSEVSTRKQVYVFAMEKANIQQIIKLYLAKKYEDCLKLIDVAMTSNENTTQLKILQSGCWTQLGVNLEAAERQLEKIIEEEPNNGFAFYGLGLLHYLLGDFKKCIEPFNRASQLNKSTKGHAETFKDYAMKILKLFQDASDEFQAGNCSKALEMLSLATLVDPENAAIKRLVKQQSDKFLQKVVGSLEDDVLVGEDLEMILNHVEFLINSSKIEAANKMMPNDDSLSTAHGWYVKGLVKYMMGSVKASILCFDKALEMDEEMQTAKDFKEKAELIIELIDTSTELMKNQENEQAVELLTEALEVDDKNKRILQAIYFQRAVAKFNMGKQQEAFNDYLLFETLQNVTGMVMEGIKF